MTVGSERRTLDVAAYERLRDELARPIPPSYSIADAACDRWASDPGRRALLDLNAPEPRWWTFADVAAASRRLANGLRGLGIVAGDRVAVLLPQGVETALAHVAIYRLGAVAVPLSTMYGPDAVAQRLADSDARLVITDVERWERLADDTALAGACPWVVAGLTSHQPPGVHDLDRLVREPSDRFTNEQVGADTPAIMVYTSGTTGPAKGVVHGHRVVAAHAAPIRLAHDEFPQPDDLLWSPADWAWAGGLVDCLLSAWHAGVPIVAYRQRKFDPEQVVDMIDRWDVRNSFLPATAIRIIQQAGLPDLRRRVRLRSVMTGGEPVGADLAGWSQDELGLVPNEVFGQTEASMVCGNSHRLLEARPGSAGLAYPGSVVEVVDPETGAQVPYGTVGEIVVRADSPVVMLGYWKRPDATAEKIVDGWLRTGDLGRKDDDGYLWFVTRRDDVIISAGYRIGPGEIEECLGRHPAVREVAVVGVPDERRGAVVSAVVVTRDGVPVDDALTSALQQHVRERLAPHEVPRTITYVDALPRTTTGKVRRAALREPEPRTPTPGEQT